MQRIIEKTEDGSATLFVPELNEHYHSVKGARTESQHIFIDMGVKASATARPHILEIGFGTGLNALLTLETAEKEKRPVHYTGIELYPLAWPEVDALKYSDNPLFEELHRAAWEEEVAITPYFTLRKVQADVETISIDSLLMINKSPFDVVYFDAFAPEKQPGMWEEKVFRNPCRHEHRWRADHLLRQRSSTPHAASRRIQGRASSRPPRRETGDTEGKERGSDNG